MRSFLLSLIVTIRITVLTGNASSLHAEQLRSRPQLTSYPYPVFANYLYTTTAEKIKESSIKIKRSCRSMLSHAITVHEMTPHKKDLELWNTIRSRPRYYKVSPSLCNSSQYASYMKGSQLCYQKDHASRRGHFHPSHPRCKPFMSVAACNPPGKLLHSPSRLTSFGAHPFLLTVTSPVHVSRSGMLFSSCEVFGLLASCKTATAGLSSTLRDREDVYGEDTTSSLCADSMRTDYSPRVMSKNCPHPYHRRLFVSSQYDDTQIGQFFLESFPRVRRV